MPTAETSVMSGIFHQLCPRCRSGKIFKNSLWLFPSMHECCPICGLKFEREEGYFLGAMYFGYGMALATIAVLTAFVWLVIRWPFQRSVVAGVVLFFPLAPMIALMARVLWIYFDQSVDPDKRIEH
jgi:uncharacterized protein (DUF983 family)